MNRPQNTPPAEAETKEDRPAGMKIVNAHLAQSIREQGMLQEPNTYGYLHLAAEIERPHPFKKNSERKQKLLGQAIQAAEKLSRCFPDHIRRVDVFDAFIIPPGSAEGRRFLEKQEYPVHLAEFDVVVLVECATPSAARHVREQPEFSALYQILEEAASFTHCFTAKNAKRIAEVDKNKDGIFLFNYFFAADGRTKGTQGIDILLAVWEYTAGWWTAKANLTNSTPLQPLEGEASEYNLINHCRWNKLRDVLPHLIFRPSMRKFVLANFTANDIVAMPILYRLAKRSS